MAAMEAPPEPAADADVIGAAASRFGSGQSAIVPTMAAGKGNHEALKAAFLAQPILFFLQVCSLNHSCVNAWPTVRFPQRTPPLRRPRALVC